VVLLRVIEAWEAFVLGAALAWAFFAVIAEHQGSRLGVIEGFDRGRQGTDCCSLVVCCCIVEGALLWFAGVLRVIGDGSG